MKQKRAFYGVLLALVLITAVALSALTAPGAGFDLGWWTVDGGGGDAAQGGYQLSATIGQSEPGPVLTGGGYELAGGFWGSTATPRQQVFVPLTLR